jgi:hypothetical protein
VEYQAEATIFWFLSWAANRREKHRPGCQLDKHEACHIGNNERNQALTSLAPPIARSL